MASIQPLLHPLLIALPPGMFLRRFAPCVLGRLAWRCIILRSRVMGMASL
jgi:hypothetical protein